MCGIAGIVYRDGSRAPDRVGLQRMSQSMAHRGPDGNGLFVQPGVGLAHTRLSIIDLGGGAQPMSVLGGTVTITFNGEIYNYKELRQDLIKSGHRFRTESDTEVILRLYLSVGEDFVSELNGMFAFAIWDSRDRKLVVARDRLGEKPLYYSIGGNGMLFASEIKAIKSYDDSSYTLCPRALDDYLAYGYVPEPRSIYQEIAKLPPATIGVWSAGEFRTKEYWTCNGDIVEYSRQDAAEEFEALLLDSMRLRLRSDVPVGAFLSGGMDSSIIAWAASSVYPDQLNTYTIGFAEASHDESADAEFTAKALGTRHTTRHVDGISLDHLPELVRQYDEPFADPSTVPTFLVTREASRDLKVCLSGDAGDELFGGYPQYLWEPLERTFGRLPVGIRRALLGVPLALLPEHVKGIGWLKRLRCSGAERFQRKIGIFPPEVRERLTPVEQREYIDYQATILHEYFELEPDEIRARQIADRETWLSGDILVKVDRSSMAHSLEVRTPFLDHRIVEFAHRLPQALKINGAEQKVLLREVARNVLPSEVLDRPKKGFGMPLRDWFRGKYRSFVEDRLISKDCALRGLLDVEGVRQVVEAHTRGQRDFSDQIWALLWLEEWARNES